MENHTVLTFTPVDHPDARVKRLGFDLADSYGEQRWGPVIGPSATLFLRRMPTLCTEQVPAAITHDELARSFGLGAGTGTNSRPVHAIDRTVRFGFATWHEQGRSLDVRLKAPGVEPHRLQSLLEWTRQAHERLLDAHVSHVVGLEDTAPKVAAMPARLDRLQDSPQNPSRYPNRRHPDRRPITCHRRHARPRRTRSKHDLVLPEDQIRRAHACRFPSGKPAAGRVSAAS